MEKSLKQLHMKFLKFKLSCVTNFLSSVELFVIFDKSHCAEKNNNAQIHFGMHLVGIDMI